MHLIIFDPPWYLNARSMNQTAQLGCEVYVRRGGKGCDKLLDEVPGAPMETRYVLRFKIDEG